MWVVKVEFLVIGFFFGMDKVVMFIWLCWIFGDIVLVMIKCLEDIFLWYVDMLLVCCFVVGLVVQVGIMLFIQWYEDLIFILWIVVDIFVVVF